MSYNAHAPNRIVTGSEIYVTVNGAADDLPPAEAYCTYLLDWELLDPASTAIHGCTAAISYQRGTNPGYPGIDGRNWVAYPPFYVHLTLPTGELASGEYKFRFILGTVIGTAASFAGGYRQMLEVPLFLSQAPLAVGYTTPEIPGLKQWQEHMVELANHWAPVILDPTNNYGENNWYYDVGSTYWQVGDYLDHSDRYADAALAAITRYSEYVRSAQPPGAVKPWCVFPRGLRQTWERTQNRQWIETMQLLPSGGYVPSAGDTDPALMRETAYAVDVWRELERIGAGNQTLLDRGVSFLLGQFNLLCAQQFRRSEGMVCQPFFFGLAMQTLIDYYDLVPDDRIPQAIAATCEWLWQCAVDAKTGYVKYDVWNSNAEKPYTSLNGLMVNAWGFLYKVTGDSIYQRQGDILFSHIFDDGEYGWTPKQFAQIYRRSIDYVVRWRA